MRRIRTLRFADKKEAALALVIVLAFVVLLTVAAVAFFSRATTERQVANSSAKLGSADTLALSALSIIVSDLKQEIEASSNATSVGEFTVYSPKISGGKPVGMVPWRSGIPTGSSTPIPNLVSRSCRPSNTSGNSPYIPYSADYTSPPPNRAADDTTTPANVSSLTPSLNGRYVTLSRWNSHYLVARDPAMFGGANAGNIGTNPVSSFVAPDWVLVTRQGPATQTGIGSGPTALNNSSSTNSNFVIGRYAYAVYDEGGLIDINVAGYPIPTPTPAPSPPQPYAFKGSLAFADLTPSTGINLSQLQVNNIVGWRNFASIALQASPSPANTPSGSINGAYDFNSATATDYYNFARTRVGGFLNVNPQPFPSPVTLSSRTDQAFVTRQDLLKYRRLTGFSQDALEFLSTFSREVNSPTFTPATPTATNPDFSQLRVTTPFVRFDGDTAIVGEPLIKARFPLSRLAWITFKGPSATLASTDPVIVQLIAAGVTSQVIQAGTAANIQACFGLSYTPSDLWTYAHGASDRILQLSEVAAAAREPDFFELLQAGILTGSLGQNTGGGVTGGTTVFPDVHMSNVAHHILSIGASIIDQADPDSIPTRIQFNPSGTMWTAYGVESLPYITQMVALAGTSPDNTTDPNPWATYLVFQVWNPHQNVPSATPTPTPPTPSATPPTVRLRVDGGLGLFKSGNGEAWTNSGTDEFFNATGQSITLNLSPTFAPSPAVLTTSNTTGAAASTTTGAFVPLPIPPASVSPTPGPLIGFRLPDFSYPTPAPTPTATPTLWLQIGASTGVSLSNRNTFNATMEVDVGGGEFVPYNHFIGINDASSWITDDSIQLRTANSRAGAPRNFAAAQLTQTPPPVLAKSDPRSTRFGIFQTSALPDPC